MRPEIEEEEIEIEEIVVTDEKEIEEFERDMKEFPEDIVVCDRNFQCRQCPRWRCPVWEVKKYAVLDP